MTPAQAIGHLPMYKDFPVQWTVLFWQQDQVFITNFDQLVEAADVDGSLMSVRKGILFVEILFLLCYLQIRQNRKPFFFL